LANEGQTAYNAAGKPTRIKTLTHLRLVTNEKNARANVNVDDITFHTTRP